MTDYSLLFFSFALCRLPFRFVTSRRKTRPQESGTLHALKDRWWKQKRGGGACADESKKGSAVNELSLGNVGGVFVVLLGGFAFSFIVALCEFMWRARKLAPDKVSCSIRSLPVLT